MVAISTDPVATSRSLSDQLKLGYPILEDRNHTLGSDFGIFHLPMNGMDMGQTDSHSIFVLDASGRVAWKKIAPDTMHVSMDDVVAAVRSA